MPDAAPAARGVYKPRRPQASPLFRLVSDHLHRLQTVYDDRFAREYGPWRPVAARRRAGCREVPRLRRPGARLRPHPLRRLHARIPTGLLRQVSLLLPELPRQAPGDLDAVAGHHAPRSRTASAGGTHDPQAAARVLSLSQTLARRDRPHRRPHRHCRHPHADRRARARRGHRRLPDAWLARQLASASAPPRHRRRLPTGRGLYCLARPRHGPVDRGVPPRRAPALRAPRPLRRRPGRRDAQLAARGVPRAYGLYGSPRTIAHSRPASRGTAHGIPSRWSDSRTTGPPRS